MASEAIDSQLVTYLRPLGRRLLLQQGQRLSVRTLWLPLGLSVALLLIGRLTPLPGYRWLAGGVPILWALAMLGSLLLRRLGPMRVARATDEALGLRYRLATALELTAPSRGNEVRCSFHTRFDSGLVDLQTADALAVARSLSVQRPFPLRWPWRPLALAAGLGLAAVLLAVLPNPQDALLAERAAVARAAEEQAAELEQVADSLSADEVLDPAEREELERQLREAIEALRANRGDLEQALADTARLEQALRSQLDPQSAAQQAALEGLGADMAALAGAADASPQLDELADLLQELADSVPNMGAAQRQGLASALSGAAAQLGGSDAALAGALSALAQDLQSGKSSDESAQVAARALERAAGDAALQDALGRALNATQSAVGALARAGQRAQAGQTGAGLGGQAGQGQSQGQGQAGGTGTGQGQGTTGGGGGTMASSGPPSRRPGRAGAPTDPNKPYEVSALDTVAAPVQRGQPGDPDFLPGRQGDQGQDVIGEEAGPQAGTPGVATVPYSEVYASYSSAAAAALEREYVPAGLKAYVQEYFTRLEP